MLDAHKQPLCVDLEFGEAGRTGETFPRPGLRTPQTACAEDPAGLSPLGLLHLSVCRHLWCHRPHPANPLVGRGTLRSLPGIWVHASGFGLPRRTQMPGQGALSRLGQDGLWLSHSALQEKNVRAGAC